jgi:hypothetical protein
MPDNTEATTPGSGNPQTGERADAPMSLDELKIAEYRQRRKVILLRARLYSNPDPTQSKEFGDQMLARAEADLQSLEKRRREREAEAKKGVLVEVKDSTKKAAGEMMGAETTGIDAQVLLRMSHVPTGIAHVLDVKQNPLVSFKLKYLGNKYARLRLVSYVDGYSSQAVDTVELVGKNAEASIDQLPTFFPDRLSKVTELTRATLHIQIDDLDKKTERQSSFPIWLMARTSAYNGIEDPATGEWVDLSYYYAAWVTPNDLEVMRLLRRAAELHPEKQMAGYQVDEDGVEQQVRAIYNALKEEQITYIHSVINFGAGQGEGMQRVRLPREAIANKSANCIDGTVLMSSVLEASSINPGFVFVPGHALLAWEKAEGAGDWDYVETTMIGTDDFDAAVRSGRKQAKEQQKRFAKSKDPNEFTFFSLAELRAQRGITPME